jgi:phenylpropionate dioxygenase-like ring-hydroxylating dioxygenase large terminal subunit
MNTATVAMPVSRKNASEGVPRSPAISVQDILRSDAKPPPVVLLIDSPRDMGRDDVSLDRYYTQDWHDREVKTVWQKTWQMACRLEDIPEVGDTEVYDIVHDSLIIVRTGAGAADIRAYVNSCLHRGTILRTEGGNVRHLKCPVHGLTWGLDGKLAGLPCAWDFPQIDREKFYLPEAQVGLWGGFVFINFDANCESLESYLECLPEHFQAFGLEDRYKAVHGGKVLPCNWKLAQEAFMEGFHIAATHPQSVEYTADTNTQYDVFDGRHVNRFIMPEGVASPALGNYPQQKIVDAMQRDIGFYGKREIKVEEGETAREKIADHARQRFSKSSGRDFSNLSTCEAIDLIQYQLFPNLGPWAGMATPLVYRFRPNGNNPEECIMEIMMLFAKNEDGTHPPVGKATIVGINDSWHKVPGMGSAADVTDQDTENLKRIQRGIRASKKPGATMSVYQESRIRHFHKTLEAYMAKG